MLVVMGNVLPPDAIIHGKIPRKGAHLEAAREIIAAHADLPEEMGVASVIYGSTAEGRSDERSDVDVYVSYPQPFGSVTGDVNRVRRRIDDIHQAVGNAYSVTVEANVLTERMIAPTENPGEGFFDPQMLDISSTEELDPLYVLHIQDMIDKRRPDLTLRTPLLPNYQLRPEHLTEDDQVMIVWLAVRFCAIKLRHMRQALAHEQVDYKALQRAFEMPKAMGRKVLAVMAMGNAGITSFDVTDKQEMQHKLHEVAMEEGATTLLKHHELLVELDRQYTELLAQTVQSGGGIDQYNQWILSVYRQAITSAAVMSLQWFRLMQKRAGETSAQFDIEGPTIKTYHAGIGSGTLTSVC